MAWVYRVYHPQPETLNPKPETLNPKPGLSGLIIGFLGLKDLGWYLELNKT